MKRINPAHGIWGWRAVSALVAAVVLSVAMSMVAYRSVQTVETDADWVVHTKRVQEQLGRVLQLLTDIETAERGYAVTRQVQFLEPYDVAIPRLATEVQTLELLVADNPRQQLLAGTLRTLGNERLEHANRVIEHVKRGDVSGARALIADGEGKRLMDAVREVVSQMYASESGLLKLRDAADQKARAAAALTICGIGALAVILLALIAYVTTKDAAQLYRAEEELAATLRSVGDAVISTDATGSVRFLNAVAENLTGWVSGAASGRPLKEVFQIVHEETRAEVENPVKKVLSGGKIVGLANHTVLISRDGSERAIEDSAAPILGSGGTLDGVVLVFRDATKERQAQRSLQTSQQRFMALAEAVPQLIWVTTPDGTNEYVNERWMAYTGLGLTESTQWEIVHSEDLERSKAQWARTLETGELYELELRLRRYDGNYLWFLARASAQRNEQGQILRWFGTCTDIDSSKRTEESLRATEAALREADARKDVFLATLAHELRNPLAPIRAAASLLQSPKLEPNDIEKACAIINRQARHMAALLDDLLDVSRITRGALTLRKQNVVLGEILDAAVETARPLLDAKQHHIKIDRPNPEIGFQADPVRLTQVIANLLTNAAKYTDPQGRIDLTASVAGRQLAISVRDTGIGLDASTLTKVFELFSQLNPESEQSAGGLGIGLALVKGLVELHGGTVEARSDGPGTGSEFLVLLPPEGNTMAQQSLATAVAPALQRHRKILLAEDNYDTAESLALLLELSGHQVSVAHTGPDAVALARRFRPDVIVLDIGLPGMDGYQVAQHIRRESWGSSATLIAVSGWGRDEDKQRAKAAGFDHHLTKPVDHGDLEQFIQSR